MAVNQQELLSKFHIKINGSDLPNNVINRVAEVVVEQSLHLPDMCIIRFHDSGDDSDLAHEALFRITDGSQLDIGSPVEILMGYHDSVSSVFKGEITSVEMEAAATTAPMLTIRGYDRSHRLHRGRYRRSFLNVTDSDLATKVAGEVGLSPNVDATTVVHDYVFQNNQTNWDFLKERAALNGYEIFVQDRTLYFRKPKNGQDLAPAQTLGQNLLSARIKTSSLFQAQQVTVQAWDPSTKQPIVGQATSGALHPSIGLGKTGAQASSGFGTSKVYVVTQPVATQSEADLLAKAIFDELDGSFINAEAVSMGDTGIAPGKTVEMKQLGTKFSGKYYVTSATHNISSDQGYTTSYVVSGQHTNSVLELAQGKQDGPPMPNVVIGIVTNNTDPEDLGRVKVKFPWLADSDESWWARIASPMAGNGRGFLFLPEVNDEVLLAFEHGDVTRPYILGALWNGRDLPPKKNSEVVSGSDVNERLIKTRAGHIVSLDDTEQAEKITIKTKAGHTFCLDDKNGSEQISIVDKTGSNLIKIESSSNKITIQANGPVLVDAKQNVDVKSETGNISVQAQTGNVSVTTQSGNAEVSTQAGSLSLKGMQISVEAQTSLSLKGNAQVQIQGGIVQIN